ncbi:hypothetical protein JDY09_03265 [Thermoleophilum album]|jgi:hypothetical protein|uniref:hypothetical protein n=1 Tax=Thermoleophilum album TaxID=29539 RepID=UPI000CBF7381|nr:hypothetical protein [Thermoleophilum album]WDT94286.1 hypothetical protein JDY09_03265 [Thermoleophilum album]GBD46575.1 hypothetical protein HRbin41_01403 [bacterium HR41]
MLAIEEMLTRRRGLAVVLALALAPAGCSFGPDVEPPPASPDTNAIAAVVEGLATAARQKRWRTICEELLTPAARERAGGVNCERFIALAASDIRDPTVRIEEITIRGALAVATVRARSAGEPAVRETLILARTQGGWRVDGLR